MGVSENSDTPKSSILRGFSIIFTIHFGVPLFLETPIWLQDSWFEYMLAPEWTLKSHYVF